MHHLANCTVIKNIKKEKLVRKLSLKTKQQKNPIGFPSNSDLWSCRPRLLFENLPKPQNQCTAFLLRTWEK